MKIPASPAVADRTNWLAGWWHELTRVEIILVLTLTACGFAVRVWNLPQQGLDHFDEGVYATSARGLYQDARLGALYRNQELFSPLVYPLLVAASFSAAGSPSDTAARCAGVLLGTLTIPLLWAIGRTWFGSRAGMIAAAGVAFNELHIALSRAVMTDVPFALFLAIAVATLAVALRSRHPAAAILAGCATGLAWNTKYHGWFALVIGAGAICGAWLFGAGNGWRLLLRRAAVLVLAGVVAAACYAPWVLYVQSRPGGYAALAAYQRTMASREWLHNLTVQVQNQAYFDGWLTRVSLLIGMACAFCVAGPGQRRPRTLLAIVAATGVSSLVVGVLPTTVALALGLALLHWDDRVTLAVWILVVWIVLWFLVTPLYHPYARLVLPFSLATLLAAGAVLAALFDRVAVEVRPRVVAPVLVAAAGLAYAFLHAPAARADPVWRTCPGLRPAAAAIGGAVPRSRPVIVIGEPALAFYLGLDERRDSDGIDILQHPRGMPFSAWVVSGIYATRSPQLRGWFSVNREQLRPIARFQFAPGVLRLIDDFVPADLTREEHPYEAYELTVYSFEPRRVLRSPPITPEVGR